ncbi:hypothetical protein M6B38_392430 [Iris pallida]|uniref:Uncharacterized protein n=1 Tax=Iris pallida TaxID=29817 RepID=A0AAX6FYW8_IRIPA|nr:hypothetical protein M6B38_392430 [Iris pallida]
MLLGSLITYDMYPHDRRVFLESYIVGLPPESPFLWDLHCWVTQNLHFYGTYTVGLSPESPFLWDLHCWVTPRISIFMGLLCITFGVYHPSGAYHLRGLSPSGYVT